ncbi:MAG TPA: hypothetical protein VNK04_04085 [Gemmataceae bacterium]|nr:hypothetical protein [Gemmataceae bacterium]
MHTEQPSASASVPASSRAGIPAAVGYRPTWHLALGQRDRALANGWHLD